MQMEAEGKLAPIPDIPEKYIPIEIQSLDQEDSEWIELLE